MNIAGVKNEFMEEFDRMLDEMHILFIRQKEPKGLGDAVRYAESFSEGEPFALLLGDNITIPPCIKQIMQIHERYNATVLALEKVPKEKLRHHSRYTFGAWNVHNRVAV